MRIIRMALKSSAALLTGIIATASANVQAQGVIPRLADGKPDFNGMWDRPRISNITQDVQGCGADSIGCSSKGSGPLEFTSEGLAVHTGPKIDWPARCLPWGYTRAYQTSYPIMYVQTADVFAILFESNNIFHIVPTDGRDLEADPEPTWMGKSVGRYEGDTLVIESNGFNGMSWLDNVGEHPTSEEMHITERIRHIDADTLEYKITIVDPKYYAKPIENTRVFVRMDDDAEIFEYWCMENNKDLMDGLLSETLLTGEH